MKMTLLEGVSITKDAATEIARIARQKGADESDVQQEIIQQLVHKRLGTTPKDDRYNYTISKADVISYEVSLGVFKPKLFYYMSGFGGFREVETEDVADEDRFDPEQETHSTDADLPEVEDEELPEADDDELPEAEEEPADAAESELDAASSEDKSLRQAHGALITKSIKDENGNPIKMRPLARLYHLLPRQAIIDHVNEVWRTHGAPFLVSAVSGDKQAATKIDVGSIEKSFKAFFDYLVYESCLSGKEIKHIADQLKASITKHLPDSGDSQREGVVALITRDVRAAISLALAERSDNSNILEYLEKDTNKVTTRDEDLLIAKSDLGITRQTIRDISRKFSEILTTQNVPFEMNAKNREILNLTLTGRSYEMGEKEQWASEQAAVLDRNVGSSMITGHAAAAADSVQSKWNQDIDDKRERSEGSILSSVMLTRKFDAAGLRPHMRVSFKVRTGETAETMHNAISDMESFQRLNRTISARQMLDTPGSKINEELQSQVQKLRLDMTQVESGVNISATARVVRDDLAFISGLIDYLAMSGLDVITRGSESAEQQTADAASSREQLIALASSVQDTALRMTDIIARAESQIENTRSLQTIQADKKQAEKRLAKLVRDRQLARRDVPSADETAARKRIEDLDAEIESSTFAKVRSAMRDDFFAALSEVDVDRIARMARDHVKYTEIDEQAGAAAPGSRIDRAKSRYTINLAAERVKRVQKIDANVKGDYSRAVRERGVASLREVGRLAHERYESQIGRTIHGLVANNKTQMHPLRMTDTIDSICDEYRIGDSIKGKDITYGSTGIVVRCALPRKYDPSGAVRDYMVISVAKGGKNPIVTLQHTVGVGADSHVSKIEVKRSEIIGSLATRGGSEEERRRRARSDFAASIRYAALRTYQQVGADILGSESEEGISFKSDEPIVAQLAEISHENDVEAGQSMVKTALKKINETFVNFKIDDKPPVDPDARVRANDRLILTLKRIAAVARLVNRGSAMEDLIRRAFPEFENTHNAIRAMLTSGGDAEGEISDIIDWADSLQDSMKDDDLRDFEASLETAIGYAAAGIEKVRDANDARSRGQYAAQYVGIDIPVPARGSLIVPGATVTVQDPKRTLNATAIENLNMLGIKPASLYSAPLLATMSALQYATFKQAFVPILSSLAEDTADEFAESIRRSYADQRVMTDQNLAEITKLCERGLRDIFVDPYARGTEYGADVDRSTIMRTYQRITAILSPGKITSFDSSSMVAMDAETERVRSAVDNLYKSLLDGVAAILTEVEGARLLYADAPCLAAILSYGTFTQRERVYINALTPTSTDELTHMTANHFRDVMVGIAKSKSGTAPLMSESVDRVNSAVKVLNDFYMGFTSESEKSTPARVVVARLRRRAVKVAGGEGAKADQALRMMLGISEQASDEQVLAAARSVAARISEEMSLLSDTSGNRNSESRIERRFAAIINERIGTRANTGMILTKLGVPAYAKGAPYDEAHDALVKWIKTTPRISHIDDAQTSRNPDDTVRFGVAQMIEDISDRVYRDVVDAYRTSHERIVGQFMQRESAFQRGTARRQT